MLVELPGGGGSGGGDSDEDSFDNVGTKDSSGTLKVDLFEPDTFDVVCGSKDLCGDMFFSSCVYIMNHFDVDSTYRYEYLQLVLLHGIFQVMVVRCR